MRSTARPEARCRRLIPIGIDVPLAEACDIRYVAPLGRSSKCGSLGEETVCEAMDCHCQRCRDERRAARTDRGSHCPGGSRAGRSGRRFAGQDRRRERRRAATSWSWRPTRSWRRSRRTTSTRPAADAQAAVLEETHDEVLADAGVDDADKVQDYTNALNGFSAVISHDEAVKLAGSPDVAWCCPMSCVTSRRMRAASSSASPARAAPTPAA